MVREAPSDLSWVGSVHASRTAAAPLGMAVVVDARRLLTAAHVVSSSGTVRDGLWVAFPMCEDEPVARREVAAVRVAAGYAPDDGTADVAVLELAEDVPNGVRAARMRLLKPSDVVGKPWWSFGFPRGRRFGNEAWGTIGSHAGHGWVRLDSESTPGLAFGFSGSGLWASAYCAVGAVIGQANDPGDGLAMTLHSAHRHLPDEKLHLLARWTLDDVDDVAAAAWGWNLSVDREADRHWRPRARGVSVVSEQGHRFRGRVRALTEIVAWLERPVLDRRIMVVTGSPGVGKSAVLGRVVTTADAQVREALPADDRTPCAEVGSVACAVHAKGKTALDVAMEIARAASAPIPDRVEDLVGELYAVLAERGGRRFNVIVDALDEASDPDEARTMVTRLLVPVAVTCADVGAQVLLGTRRADDGGELLAVFDSSATTIDLDDPRYFALDDLTAYALATLQLRGSERPDNPYQDERVATPVARRIAEIAEPNFLVAGLMARKHGLYDARPVAVADIGFTRSVRDALDGYVDHLAPVDGVSAREALTALAFAEAPGFTIELWAEAVLALGGPEVTDLALRKFATGSAANFLVESSGRTASYRLFHQALAESLVEDRGRVASPERDEAALSRAFLACGARIGWVDAPEYLSRSLSGHATRGATVDLLLADVDYVSHADL
ncbi:MAG: trypsin-like peptidase domain-containing protein, partial [Pseudonocardia sp.]